MKRALLTLLLLSGAIAHASEIYQIVDENGRKTYTNIVPPTEHNLEKVILSDPNLSHDSNALDDNDRYYEELAAEELQHAEIGRHLKQTEQAARSRLAESEAELNEAREIRAGDYFNIPGKGLRYTEAYQQRVREAEVRRDSARAELDQLRNRKPAQPSTTIDELYEEDKSHLPH